MQTAGTGKRVFRNRAGHLRAGWRILTYAVIVGLVGLTAAGFSRVLHDNVDGQSNGDSESDDERFDSWIGVIGFLVMDFILIIAAIITLRFIDKRPIAMLGLSLSRQSLQELLVGFSIGAGAISAACSIMWASGALHVTLGTADVAFLAGAGRFLLVFCAAAAVEELIMRGYPFQAFAEGSGALLAVLLFNLVFAFGHLTNTGWTLVGLANTGISGVLMSLAYLKTRSLWMPIAIHLSWNWTQGCIWGMNVSGLSVSTSLLETTPRNPTILSGGTFGAEGSLITLAVIIPLCLYAWKAKWLKPSPKNATLWKPYLSDATETTEHLPPHSSD